MSRPDPDEQPDGAPQDDDGAVRRQVARLARPHISGGHVVERAALQATGRDLAAALTWIEAHGGRPEHATAAPSRGLHGDRAPVATAGVPLRFVLPPGALD